ncbi:hypothetical protein [Pedobacter cryoconitis]|nr:hypothetical protein [Pedobacter cryoconitis]
MDKPAWMEDRTKERDYNAKLVYSKDAYHSGCWIYSERTGKLYTPREFLESDEVISWKRGEEEKGIFTILDPRKFRYLILENVKNQTEEAINLEKRIDEYYEMSPRPKNKKPKFNV